MSRPTTPRRRPAFHVPMLVLTLLLAAAAESPTPSPTSSPATTPSPTATPSPAPEAIGGETALLLVMDASGSMNADGGDGRPRIAAAKDALRAVVEELPDEARVGLRVYGHRVGNDESLKAEGCEDTELVAPVAPLDRDALVTAIEGFDARGWTPIGRSLRAAVEDLPDAGDRRVVLVSDGIDTCAPPDPCTVAEELAAEGVEITVDTVGFQVEAEAREQLECIARVTGGTYRDVPDAADLGDELRALSVRAFRGYAASGRPVQGTPGTEGAPLLEAGVQYRDTIHPGTDRVYAFELLPGQQATLSAVIAGSRFAPRRFGEARLEDLGTHLGLGEVACGTATMVDAPERTVVLFKRVQEVQVDGIVACREAGRRNLAVRLIDGPEAFGPEPRLVELLVTVEGEPVVEEPLEPTGGDTVPPSPATAADDEPEPSGNTSSALLWSLGAALLGGAGGFGGARWWSRR